MASPSKSATGGGSDLNALNLITARRRKSLEADPAHKTARLLFLDDDRDDYLLTCHLLTGVPGRRYEIDWASNPEEAIEAMTRKKYDVCLVDYYLGCMTGPEFIRLTAERGICVPMIILTGDDSAAADMASQEAGADEFLSKNDITVKMLDRSVRYVMERAETIASLRDSTRFLQSVLDSLSAQIAIIEESGEINCVNKAWVDFGVANGRGDQGWSGVNYLKVCDRAGAAGDQMAAEVSRAIRGVLDGRKTSYCGEYPCNGPEERRWYRVTVTRLQHLAASWAVVAHYNITDRRNEA